MSVQHLKLSSHSGFEADATVTDDGRVDIAIDETDPGKLAALLVSKPLPASSSSSSVDAGGTSDPKLARLNIVIQVVGSRGDVQPFVALGHVLRRTYGHRVRLVTHSVFKEFVEAPERDRDGDGGRLEFFDIGGGDPAELMSFMVQNGKTGQKENDDGGGGQSHGDKGDNDDDKDGGGGGLIPPMESYTNGEIAGRRRFIEAVLHGCWRSMADDQGNASDGKVNNNGGNEHGTTDVPFVADAIIANPPSFAHIHIAESLGVPLHIMFTMPWTPTRSFPHPLANLKCISSASSFPSTDVSSSVYGFASFLSYTIVECLTWQGLGDIINRFRSRNLGLEPLSPLLAVAPFHQGGLMGRLQVPTTYCWSPSLLPKPPDWGAEITVAGYFFSAATSGGGYTPQPELAAFLAAGKPPIYIGFGSIVVDDPVGLTKTIVDAVGRLKGARAIVSKGWGGLGEGDAYKGRSKDIFFLESDCPHEWLFPRMACVVHHGGAGTTAAGLRFGVPSVVVPFFGDQPFWGSLVAQAGAGPDPVPFSRLTAERLAAAIELALRPTTKTKAAALGDKIRDDKDGGGAVIGAQSFHKHLSRPQIHCQILPDRLAVWQYRNKTKKTTVGMSALAAAILVHENKLAYSDLALFRAQEYHIHTGDQPWEPITGAGSAILGDLSSIAMAVADFPQELFRKAKKASNDGGDKGAGTTDGGTTTVKVDTPSATVTLDTAVQAGQSIGRIVSTGLQTPLHFCLGLARGFHNAPRLYHDDTVRALPGVGTAGDDGGRGGAEPAVDGLGGGIRAASKAFGLGLYDGVTGLVTQPLQGAEQSGGKGFVKGFAKGIGGVVFKPAAGAWSVPAYTMQGVQAEVQKLTGGVGLGVGPSKKEMQARRMAARMRQSEAEWQEASVGDNLGAESQAVLERWTKAEAGGGDRLD
ncbi:glucosylltransferase family 28 protein [Sporothrix schenckii 1099-18]|uniref:Glucosylltransferase family 28 protein n=1 Tax=Sporothrix schenckii 1099-18 TaxID=1397361 RepID=A0A0F2MJ93_SPOSC|nr:glucosylltransferase family 28 protein [Sporothrix schenckii 1099-18]KJR89124.1 glucosylltransferase family 28 protein [Sporothrix schenckii 1099-18]